MLKPPTWTNIQRNECFRWLAIWQDFSPVWFFFFLSKNIFFCLWNSFYMNHCSTSTHNFIHVSIDIQCMSLVFIFWLDSNKTHNELNMKWEGTNIFCSVNWFDKFLRIYVRWMYTCRPCWSNEIIIVHIRNFICNITT